MILALRPSERDCRSRDMDPCGLRPQPTFTGAASWTCSRLERLASSKPSAYKKAWAKLGALTSALNYYRATSLHPPGPGEPGVTSVQFDPAATVVRVPTQVIWGEKDPALLTCLLDGLEEFVPNLRIDRIPDGTHWVTHEFPDQVNRLIRDFLTRSAPRTSGVAKTKP